MTLSEEKLQLLVKSAEERESIARRRAALYSLIPIVLAVLLLWFTGWQIRQANQELAIIENELEGVLQEQAATKMQLEQTQQELEMANSQLEQTQQALEMANSQLDQTQQELEKTKSQLEQEQQELDELEDSLEETTKYLQEARTFQQYAYQIDETSLKQLSMELPYPMSDLLLDILGMQYRGIGWKLGGFSPDEGFDSPSFAAYMLDTYFFLPGVLDNRYSLKAVLPPGNQPRVGSLVFYELGYTMFYFEDTDNTPFVIGMTPLGIIALRENFAPILGYGYFYP